MALPAGSLISSNGDCKSSIWVPTALDQGISWRCDVDAAASDMASTAAFTSAAAFQQLGVLSAYFPDLSTPDSEFDRALHESRMFLSYLVDVVGCKWLILCCDLNQQLTGDIDNLTGSWFHKSSEANILNREIRVVQTRCECSLCAVNTFDVVF